MRINLIDSCDNDLGKSFFFFASYIKMLIISMTTSRHVSVKESSNECLTKQLIFK